MIGNRKRNPDDFKPLGEVLEPDRRQTAYSILDPTSGQFRRKTLEDHYAVIERFTVHRGVPAAVRIHFDTARNLLLYAWYAYRIIPVAELHAISTVEMTLRIALGHDQLKRRPTLRRLLQEAIDRELVRDEGFSHFHRIRERRAEYREMMRGLDASDVDEETDEPLIYTRRIFAYMSDIRNTLAHGSPMLMPHGYLWLGTCCDLINQLTRVPSHEAELPT